MTREEIRDWPGLKDLALSWWIGARFFDAGEVCELKLQTITCLASLYVGKQHRRRRRSKTVQKGQELSPGYSEKATTDPNLRKYNLFLYLCLYFYVLTTIIEFLEQSIMLTESKLAVIYAPSLGCLWFVLEQNGRHAVMFFWRCSLYILKCYRNKRKNGKGKGNV